MIVIVLMVRSFKERIQETEEAHGLLNNHLQTNVQVIFVYFYLDLKQPATFHKKSFSHISFICVSVQEISDLDEHIAILK